MRSVYVVRTRVARLGERPLGAGPVVREGFRTFFSEPRCFGNAWDQVHGEVRLPFLRSLGAVGLSLEWLRILCSDRYLAHQVPALLSTPPPPDELVDLEDFEEESFFGYLPNVADQRMLCVPHSLLRPVRVEAYEGDRAVAAGTLFLHLFPSGYVVTHLAVALREHVLRDPDARARALRETQPWKGGTWTWRSRIGSSDLETLVERVHSRVRESLLAPDARWDASGSWTTTVAAVSDEPPSDLARSFLPFRETDELPDPFWFTFDEAPVRAVLPTRRGVLVVGNPERPRRAVLRVNWRVLALLEFVLLKDSVYRDYLAILRDDVRRLKQIRLDGRHRLRVQDVTELFVYDVDLGEHVTVLDRMIHSTSALYRALYTKIAREVGHDDVRAKLQDVVGDWESEVEKYDPLVTWLWKRVLAPVRTAFATLPR